MDDMTDEEKYYKFPPETPELSSLSDVSEECEEGEIATETEFEIEPEELKRKTQQKRKRKLREKRRRKDKAAKLTVPTVTFFHESKIPSSKIDTDASCTKLFQEISPSRDCVIEKRSEKRVFFDGIKIPENFLGKVFLCDSLRKSKVHTSVFPFMLMGNEKKNGFWLDLFNKGRDKVVLRSDRPCAYLCLTQLHPFHAQHEQLYSAANERKMGLARNQSTLGPDEHLYRKKTGRNNSSQK